MNQKVLLRDQKLSSKFSSLIRKVGKAVTDYNMIEEGDKILVAVSGGKDSFALLHLLDFRRRFSPIKYELIACYLHYNRPSEFKERMKEYFEKYEFKYVIKNLDILDNKDMKKIGCFWCSWNRRKILFQTAKELNCKKLALGHHLDDIAQSILLNIIFHGEISCSPPYLEFFEGELIVIRPLCYIEKRLIQNLSKSLEFPDYDIKCPVRPDSKRTLIKEFINSLSSKHNNVKINIFNSLRNIRERFLT